MKCPRCFETCTEVEVKVFGECGRCYAPEEEWPDFNILRSDEE